MSYGEFAEISSAGEEKSWDAEEKASFHAEEAMTFAARVQSSWYLHWGFWLGMSVKMMKGSEAEQHFNIKY